MVLENIVFNQSCSWSNMSVACHLLNVNTYENVYNRSQSGEIKYKAPWCILQTVVLARTVS